MPKDQKRGFTLLLKAAQLGNAQAQSKVGIEYRFGGLVASDLAKAYYWLLKSARQGNVTGQFIVAQHYFYGEGIKQDKVRGLAWLLIAAEKDRQLAKHIVTLERKMTKRQILAAKSLANRWWASKQ